MTTLRQGINDIEIKIQLLYPVLPFNAYCSTSYASPTTQWLKISGSLRPSSDISYIDFLNSELNLKLSSYFEKPFKLNNSKKNTIEYYET